MYSLDINFLKDRPEYKPDPTARSRQRSAGVPGDRRPLIAGAIALAVFPAIVGGYWFYLYNRNADLTQQARDLDNQLGNLEAKKKEVASLQSQTKTTQDETQALASVFNTIKPWSALMQDIRDRTPANIRILSVKQLPPERKPAPGGTPATPPPAGTPTGNEPMINPVTISGAANSFNDVNDFLLVLQKSSFLQATETKLLGSELKPAVKLTPLRLKNSTGGGDRDQPNLPREVTFEIRSATSDATASELLRELNRKGAVGLFSRIEELQRRGILKQ